MSTRKIRPASGPRTVLPDDWNPVDPTVDGFCYLLMVDDITKWQLLAFVLGPYPTWRAFTEATTITSTKPFTRKLDRNGYYHIYSDGVGVPWYNLGFKPGDVLGSRAVCDDYYTAAHIMAAAVMVSMLFGCMSKGILVFAFIGVWTLKLNQYTDSCEDHNDFTIEELQALQKDPKAEIFHPVCESKLGFCATTISFWSAWTQSIISHVKMMALVIASLRKGGGCVVLMAIFNMGRVMATPTEDVIGKICTAHAGESASICYASLSQLHSVIGGEFDRDGSTNKMCLESPESRQRLIEHEIYPTSDEFEKPVFDVMRIEYVQAFCPDIPSTDPEWWPAAKHLTYIALKKKREGTENGFKTCDNPKEEKESKVKSSTTGQLVDGLISLSTSGLTDVATSALSASHTMVTTVVSAQGHVQGTANSLIGTSVEVMRATADEVAKQAAVHTNVIADVVGKTVGFADAFGVFSADALFASANGAIGVVDAVKDAAKATIEAATDHINEHAGVPAVILGKTMTFADAIGSLGNDAMFVGTTGAIEVALAVTSAAKTTIEAAAEQIKEHAGVPAVILEGTIDIIDKVAAALPTGGSVGEHVGMMGQHTANAATGIAKALMDDGVGVASTVTAEAVEWRGAMFNTYNAVKTDVKEMVPAVYANTKAGVGHAYDFMKSEFYSPTTLKNDMAATNEKIRGVSANVGGEALKVGANVVNWATSKSATDWKETIKSAAEALPATVEILTKTAIRPVDVVVEHMNIDKTTFTDMIKRFREAMIGESPVEAVTTGVKDLRVGLFGEMSIASTWSWLTTTAFTAAPFAGPSINPSAGLVFMVCFAIIGVVGVGVLVLKGLGISCPQAYDPLDG